MSLTTWGKMLDVYVYDYLVKRDLKASAQVFQAEAGVYSDLVAIDAPSGFLLNWWLVFCDMLTCGTNNAPYLETESLKLGEQNVLLEQQQTQQSPHQLQQQRLRMRQHFLRLAQQLQEKSQQMPHWPPSLQLEQHQPLSQPQQLHRRHGIHLLNVIPNVLAGDNPLMSQNPGNANALAAKMYEEQLKLPLQRGSLDDATKKRFDGNVSQLADSWHAYLLQSPAAEQPSGQVFDRPAGAMSLQIQSQNQQLPRPLMDMKTQINAVLNPRSAGPTGSSMGIPGPNQGGNNFTLKRWALKGLDQTHSAFLQQRYFKQASQPLCQLEMLMPQHQQSLMPAQQNLTSASAIDIEIRKHGMPLNNTNMPLQKDDICNSVGNVALPAVCPILSHADQDVLIEAQLQQQQDSVSCQQSQVSNHNRYHLDNVGNNSITLVASNSYQGNAEAQLQQQNHGHFQQNVVSCQQSQLSNYNLHHSDNIGTNSISMDSSMSNSFQGNDQAQLQQQQNVFSCQRSQVSNHSLYQADKIGLKRKQPASSSEPANISGMANTGLSPNSVSSSLSTHTLGDVVAVPSSPYSSSMPSTMFEADGAGTPLPMSNKDDKELETQAHLLGDESQDDNAMTYLSDVDMDHRDPVDQGFTFTEMNSVHSSSDTIVCCDFSSDGKLLASGGHDNKVVLWYTHTLMPKTMFEEHSSLISDICFSPSMSYVATSSFDKSVRVWDTDIPAYSLRCFGGHSAPVMSLDFHPNKDDFMCSCDGDGEIRYWSITNGCCTGVFKGGMTQIRFQPCHGRYIAAASENLISILDVETQACLHRLQGHMKPVHSVCWDPTGEFLASVSGNSVRLWTFGLLDGACVHEFSCDTNTFFSCEFHPKYPHLLVIGSNRSLELWNVVENKTMTLLAHEGLITSLAASQATGLMASASDDKTIKLWK